MMGDASVSEVWRIRTKAGLGLVLEFVVQLGELDKELAS